jgi:tetratricopeptide (TPR) repeat protein
MRRKAASARRAAILLGILVTAGSAAAAWWPYRGSAAHRSHRHVARGDRLLEKEKTDAAIIEYRTAVQIDPASVDANAKLGRAYFRIGDMARASDVFRRIADLVPDALDRQLTAGEYALLASRFEEAQKEAQQVLDREPANAEALALLANALAGQGDFDSAISTLQQALETEPLHAGTFNNLGLLLLADGRADEAHEAFAQGAALGGHHSFSAPTGFVLPGTPPSGGGTGPTSPAEGTPSGSNDLPGDGPGYIIADHLDLGVNGPPHDSDAPTPRNRPSLVLTANLSGGDDPVVEFHAYDEKTGREISGFAGNNGPIGFQSSESAPVPEPGALVLLGGGLMMIAYVMRQRTA